VRDSGLRVEGFSHGFSVSADSGLRHTVRARVDRGRGVAWMVKIRAQIAQRVCFFAQGTRRVSTAMALSHTGYRGAAQDSGAAQRDAQGMVAPA
jgi:hypothetical protein